MRHNYRSLPTDDGAADGSAECGCMECRCAASGHPHCGCRPVLRPFLYFRVEGMHCRSCSFRIELSLRDTPGVSAAEVDLPSKRLRVGCRQNWDPSTVEKVVLDTVTALGFSIQPQAYTYHVPIPKSITVLQPLASLSSSLLDLGWHCVQGYLPEHEIRVQLCSTPDPADAERRIAEALHALGVPTAAGDVSHTTQTFLHVMEPSPPSCCGSGFQAVLTYTVAEGLAKAADQIPVTLKQHPGIAECTVAIEEKCVKVVLAPNADLRAVRLAVEEALSGLGCVARPAQAYAFSFLARSGPSGWRTALQAAVLARFPQCTLQISGQTVAITVGDSVGDADTMCAELQDLAQGLAIQLRPVKVEVLDAAFDLHRAGAEEAPSGCCAAAALKPAHRAAAGSTGCVAETAPTTVAAAADASQTAQFLVQGMSCASCAAKIEMALGRTRGVQQAVVNFATMSAKVRYAPAATSAAQLAELIVDLGYAAQEVAGDAAARQQCSEAFRRTEEIRSYSRQLLLSCVFTAPLLLLMVADMWPGGSALTRLLDRRVPGLGQVTWDALLEFALATPVVVFGGRGFYREAWSALRRCGANMQVLISLGVAAAYLGSVAFLVLIACGVTANTEVFFTEAAVLIASMLLGKLLECLAKRKTSEALLTLMDLQPVRATRVDTVDGVPREEEVDVEFIAKGDVLKVMAGDRVPIDGEIVLGSTTVDESMVTGEAVPVSKHLGDPVVGGTINVDGLIHVRATKVGDETMLAQIWKSVHEAQTNKAPIQVYADALASAFVPVVIAIASLSLATWLTCGYLGLYPEEWYGSEGVAAFSLRFFISSLVVACPCAMGLATPTAVMVGSGVGAASGLLIKGGEPLETLAKVTAILFDKTGTLTQGVIEVKEARLLGPVPPAEAWRLIGEAEGSSGHPVALAIARYCAQQAGQQTFGSPSAVYTFPGRGIQCSSSLNGSPVSVQVGSVDYIAEMFELPPDVVAAVAHCQNSAMTVVLAGLQPEGPSDDPPSLLALFALADALKPEAAAVLRVLQKDLKLDVHMVSGDHRRACEAVAAQLRLPRPHVHGGVLPREKAACVAQRRAAGHIVAFVGDGINDAPALASADVGVAVGAGTQVAMQCADVVLLGSGLTDVVAMLSLARATMLRIRLNFLWAFGYNVVALPIAAGALYPWTRTQIPPMVAGAAMVASSLTVLLCSLSLRLWRRPAV